MTKNANIVFGVKRDYEKEGVYINAEKRLHLSTPLVDSNMPDDWEVLVEISKRLGERIEYKTSEDVFNDVTKEVKRFKYATYERLKKRPLSWPITKEGDTPILHIKEFSTNDKKCIFIFILMN